MIPSYQELDQFNRLSKTRVCMAEFSRGVCVCVITDNTQEVYFLFSLSPKGAVGEKPDIWPVSVLSILTIRLKHLLFLSDVYLFSVEFPKTYQDPRGSSEFHVLRA